MRQALARWPRARWALGPYQQDHRRVTLFYMRARFLHRNVVDDPGDWAEPLALAGRACCCPARPVVTVVMPPTSARKHPVDLLLCGHHYRVCRAALAAAGATVYDETGALITTGGLPARHRSFGPVFCGEAAR